MSGHLSDHIDENTGRITPGDTDWLAEQALTDGPPKYAFDPFDRPMPTIDNDGQPRHDTTPVIEP